MARARVLLAEDHTAVAERLRGLLDTEFQVIATVSDGWGMVGAARALRPDVIVADVSMPGIDGIEAATKILSDDPAARVVFVTVHDDAVLVQRSRDIGARGYVIKASAGDDLLPAVRAALRDAP